MDEQLKRLKEIKKSKNYILKTIDNDNLDLLRNLFDFETILKELRELNREQKQIWKERHKIRRLKYDQSERGKELSRIRSQKNYQKKKTAKAQ